MPLISHSEAEDFASSFGRIVSTMKRLGKNIAPGRESMIFELGLRGAHIEEAIAHGEWDRAQAHFGKAKQIIQQL